jgi:ribosomal subunit interface protein
LNFVRFATRLFLSYNLSVKLSIKTVGIELTPSFRTFIESKLPPLAKFVGEFDALGETEIWLEVGRTTKHHKRGEVFWAAADLRLPKKILRAEARSNDARAAIDEVKDKLRLEIGKYRTQFVKPKRG